MARMMRSPQGLSKREIMCFIFQTKHDNCLWRTVWERAQAEVRTLVRRLMWMKLL